MCGRDSPVAFEVSTDKKKTASHKRPHETAK